MLVANEVIDYTIITFRVNVMAEGIKRALQYQLLGKINSHKATVLNVSIQ